MKVSELKDELLDYWVAKANGVTEVHVVDAHCRRRPCALETVD